MLRSPLNGQIQRQDGCTIDYALLPLPDGATLLSFADVTAAKRMERVLTERNEALIAADKLKNHFISHVSYELRTPLQTITGFHRTDDEPADRLADAAAARLSRHGSDGIRDPEGRHQRHSRPGRHRCWRARTQSGADQGAGMIEEVSSCRARAAGEGQSQARGFDRAVGDRDRGRRGPYPADARQLLSNAIGFSEAGKTVRLSCRKLGDDVLFTIEDEGVGIPKEDLPKVFERFVSRTQGSSHRGAGLGLPLVKSLAELHGGSVWIESEPGQGTSVHLRLPERGRAKAAGRARSKTSSPPRPRRARSSDRSADTASVLVNSGYGTCVEIAKCDGWLCAITRAETSRALNPRTPIGGAQSPSAVRCSDVEILPSTV